MCEYKQRKEPTKDNDDSKFNPPFYQTTAMACCLPLNYDNDPVSTEYARAAYYGRPLFAVMADDSILDDKISTVLTRTFLLDKRSRKGHQAERLNQSSVCKWDKTIIAVTSDLVAKGYANLSCTLKKPRLPNWHTCQTLLRQSCHVYDGRRLTCQLPDAKERATANDKQWWTRKLQETFSSGIASPEKGDFGEVVAHCMLLYSS